MKSERKKPEIIMSERVARKDYRCWRCGELIAKGELYYDNRKMGKSPSHLFRLEPRLEDFRSGGDTWKDGVRERPGVAGGSGPMA